MIISYNSSIPINGGYSNLSSHSTDLICTNCAAAKGQKGKRNYVEHQSYQTRTITDHESGEVICSTCGMVISDKIQSNGSEGLKFEQGGSIIGNSAESNAPKKRPGSTSSLARYDKGLYTVIGERDNDAYGRQLDPLVRHSMHKIRMYDVRTQTAFRDRNRRRAFADLYKFKNKIGLSDAIVEKTAYIYRKAEKRGIIRGRTIPSISLSMSEKTKRRAIELMDLINKKDRNTYTSGKDPMGLAATVLFVASANNGENMTQRGIATAAGLTTVTIRCRLKEIGKYLESFGNQE